MTFLLALAAAFVVIGLPLLAHACVLLFRGRFGGAALRAMASVAILAIAACIGLVAENLATYQRLTHETPAAKLAFTQTAPRQFNAVLTYPDGNTQQFVLRGDEWQLDARVLKWKPVANILGFDTGYRLERLSGRYSDVASERTEPRTVYALTPDAVIDVWNLAQRHSAWLPAIDAYYGSATYLPMADGAKFAVSVSPSGLVARSENDAGRGAIDVWH
jgi:hypothetical protein